MFQISVLKIMFWISSIACKNSLNLNYRLHQYNYLGEAVCLGVGVCYIALLNKNSIHIWGLAMPSFPSITLDNQELTVTDISLRTVEAWDVDVTISCRARTESACSKTNTHTLMSGGTSCKTVMRKNHPVINCKHLSINVQPITIYAKLHQLKC